MTARESTLPHRPCRRRPLHIAVSLALSVVAAVAHSAPADPAADEPQKKETTQLEGIVVSAPDYVPKETNGAAKSNVPLIETPQSVTVITRDQIDLLDWQNLSQVVRYTAGIIGENYGPDPRYDWLTLRGFYPPEYIDGLQAPIGSVSNVGVDLYGFQNVEVLKGPSSTLYGLSPPGGIVNLTSRRPEAQFSGEVQAQYGSYANTQLAADFTGPLDADGRFLGRITALWFDKGTQAHGVDTDRYYVAPALTWVISPETNLTWLSYFQHDDVYGDGGGFLPIQGVAAPNPLGRVPTSTNLGEPNYNHFDRDQYGVGYDFNHKFNDDWRFEQNLKYFSSDVKILQVYGAGLATNPDGSINYGLVNRNNFPFNENVKSFNVDSRVEGKFDTGAAKHNLLVGIDYRRYTDNSEFGFAYTGQLGPDGNPSPYAVPPLNLFNPVYGAPIVTPPLSPYVNEVQKQAGLYVQDQIKIDRWVLTLGGREDNVTTTSAGTSSTENKFTYHAGLNYLFDGGVAPYVSYATSFQPTPGADFSGKLFKPTEGNQVEAGIKYQPVLGPGKSLLFTAAVYDLTQKNVLTTDPGHAFFNVQTGEVEVKGVELEAVARFNETWSFNAAYTYTDSEVTKANDASLGKQLLQVPKQMLSGLVDYTQQEGSLAGLGASLGMRYVGKSYGDSFNQFPAPSVVLWDATVHYNLDKWVLQLNVANLFDREYLSRCSDATACYYGLRRAANFTITRKF
ncbi:MAG: TonB-dependent siderophore receptor [Rudaea sp.]|nr:TonB-dependent siderophore receptor [Rudaea sp.]